jgi:16S rRNA (cytosine967-C5)-methyltransferase
VSKDRSVKKDQSTPKQGQVRKLALEALIRIEEDRAYSNLVLDRLLQKHVHLSQRDRRLLTQIVYGTVQQQRLLDFQLQPFLKQKVSQLDRWVRQLLRLSVYQIMFLDRIPERAVVHEAVELAGKYGHRGVKGMVNGVLRNFLRGPRVDINRITDPIKRLAVETSHPTWMVKRWTAQYGLEKTASICRANNEQAPLTLRSIACAE